MHSPDRRQPWIHSALLDVSLIVGPPLFSGLFVLALGTEFQARALMGPLLWLALVVCIDVAHVYASLFRTYWGAAPAQASLRWAVPLGCWVAGIGLYALSAALFWTALAYIAVFHFIRQQYGFAMIYARHERTAPKFFRVIDKTAIYVATLYPLLFWHTHLPRQFNWFTDGDFLSPPPGSVTSILSRSGFWLYVAILAIYLVKELAWSYSQRFVNIPKNTLVVGTALAWYVGIVHLNNDLAFTVTNVISHGIPYVVLIWLYGSKVKPERRAHFAGRPLFTVRRIPLYFGLLVVFAYLEEGLWDGLVWRDHGSLFSAFQLLPLVTNPLFLAFLVPLLALPQSTHYVFDAFLWRVNGRETDWKHLVLNRQES